MVNMHLDLLRHLDKVNISTSWAIIISTVTHLDWRQERAPFMYELHKHSVWPTLVYFSEPAEDGELFVRHAHVGL